MVRVELFLNRRTIWSEKTRVCSGRDPITINQSFVFDVTPDELTKIVLVLSVNQVIEEEERGDQQSIRLNKKHIS